MEIYKIGKFDTDKDLWNIYHTKKHCIVGIFEAKEDAINVCEELNKKKLGKIIKSWPDV